MQFLYFISLFISCPQKVVKEFNKIQRQLLWGRKEEEGKARVKWEKVCSPKEEEGLGQKIFTSLTKHS